MVVNFRTVLAIAIATNLLTEAGASAFKAAVSQAYQIVYGNPSQPVCPTANCPPPPAPPVLATQILHGRTTKPASQSEWLSTVGLLVATGAQQIGSQISGQKVAQYIGVLQAPGAGTVWSLNTDTVRNGIPGGPNSFGGFEGSGKPGRPGAIGAKNGTIGYELDFTNWDSDSAPGSGAFTAGQYVHAQGSYTSLGALYFDANMAQGKRAWHAGLFFNGHDVIGEHTLLDASDSERSFTLRGHHSIGFDASGSNADMHAIVLRDGQTACFNGAGNCARFHDGRFILTNAKDQPILTIDEAGNLVIAGRMIQGGGK